MHFKTKCHLFVCGSVSAWIEKNIINSSDYVGRISKIINLGELSLSESLVFWRQQLLQTSFKDQLHYLAVTGGVPLYLEYLNPKENAFQNLNRLCFSQGALLVREFESIFNDIFGRRSAIYKKIISALLQGPKNISMISKSIKKEKNGVLSQYLEDLSLSGFVNHNFFIKLEAVQIRKFTTALKITIFASL